MFLKKKFRGVGKGTMFLKRFQENRNSNNVPQKVLGEQEQEQCSSKGHRGTGTGTGTKFHKIYFFSGKGTSCYPKKMENILAWFCSKKVIVSEVLLANVFCVCTSQNLKCCKYRSVQQDLVPQTAHIFLLAVVSCTVHFQPSGASSARRIGRRFGHALIALDLLSRF